MGFEGRKVLKLKFDDPEFEGLEVLIRRPTIEQALAVADAQDALGEDASHAEKLRPVAELLCSLLIGWNLENDGQQVGHTADALLAQDAPVVTAIISAWEEHAMGRVSGPLVESSNDGEPSLVASLPMEPLSENQAS